MKIAHLADLHLGYEGRGADVIRAFESAMHRVGELEPKAIVIAGDVFDRPGVTAPALAAFSKAVTRLRGRLMDTSIVAVAGSRDTPLDPDRPGPLDVAGALEGVEVAVRGTRSVRLLDGELNVGMVPHLALMGTAPLEIRPDPAARWNVLVAHTSVGSDDGHAMALDVDDWDYVALGSEHGHRRLSDRVWYAGSLERVDADPWAEAATGKGFLLADLEAEDVTFWPTDARAVISLAPIEATGGGPATVARRLSEALAGVPGGVEGKLVRIPVRGLSADDLAALDREVIEPVRRRAAEVRVDALPGQGASHGREGSPVRAGVLDEEHDLGRLLALARQLADEGPDGSERRGTGT